MLPPGEHNGVSVYALSVSGKEFCTMTVYPHMNPDLNQNLITFPWAMSNSSRISSNSALIGGKQLSLETLFCFAVVCYHARCFRHVDRPQVGSGLGVFTVC